MSNKRYSLDDLQEIFGVNDPNDLGADDREIYELLICEDRSDYEEDHVEEQYDVPEVIQEEDVVQHSEDEEDVPQQGPSREPTEVLQSDSSDDELGNDSSCSCDDFYEGKRGFHWCKTPPAQSRRRSSNIVSSTPGLTKSSNSIFTIPDAFHLFFDENMLKQILLYTNMKGKEVFQATNLKREVKKKASPDVERYSIRRTSGLHWNSHSSGSQ